jgi:fructose-1,6-bisphosphatase/inositol monophosphatase family enzyme
MDINYDIFYKKALELAKVAGKMIKEAWDFEKSIEHKGKVDLVTKTDKEIENFIIDSIKKDFPTHSFLAEESYKGGSYNFTDNPTWIIDPIDGTTNFIHKYPFVCVSIAFAIQRKVVVGIVFNPILNELFTAIRGKGAFLNEKKISVSSVSNLFNAIIATNVGYDRSEEGANFMLQNIKTFLINDVQSIRSEGTAAMDLCGVACGRLDCFYEFGVHPWDIAAGYLIVEEAGGIIIDPLDGETLYIENRRVLAGNKTICDIVFQFLQKTPIPIKHQKKNYFYF